MQCCTCLKWVRLRCIFFYSSKFNSLSSSQSWCCPSCSISVSPGVPFLPTLFFLRAFQHVYLHCRMQPCQPPSVNAALSSHPRLLFSYPPAFLSLAPLEIFFTFLHLHSFTYVFLPHFTCPQFSNGTREVFVLEVENFFVSFLSGSRSPTSTPPNFFDPWILVPTIVLHSLLVWFSFLDSSHADGGVVIFVRQGLRFLNFQPFLSLCLTSTLTT